MTPSFQVFEGDSLDVLPILTAESVDAIVCDPPYGLSFMGKEWDHGVPGKAFWVEALKVAKPGAHLVAFGGTRTYHRLACAIEDAGWEIRDCLMWLYGTGFPKSLDVSKAMDKTEGHWRDRASGVVSENGAMGGPNYGRTEKGAPITDLARQWAGWGTALKPAWEPIIFARKPLVGTVAANVAEYGTGGLNIDGCRIGTGGQLKWERPRDMGYHGGSDAGSVAATENTAGRWPANVVLDEEAAALLDEQSGTLKAGVAVRRNVRGQPTSGFVGRQPDADDLGYGDSGGASRFFYCAKAGKKERSAGLEGQNVHPTVKPVALMRWLCRLVTPPNGLVLDPFTGSGSTGIAAVTGGFRFIGIEREAEYVEIATRRMTHWATEGAE